MRADFVKPTFDERIAYTYVVFFFVALPRIHTMASMDYLCTTYTKKHGVLQRMTFSTLSLFYHALSGTEAFHASLPYTVLLQDVQNELKSILYVLILGGRSEEKTQPLAGCIFSEDPAT